MKITCEKKELLRILNAAGRAVPARTTLPILTCALLEAADGAVTATGNDLELGVTAKAPCEVVEPGSAAIDAKLLSEVARKIPDGLPVEIDAEGPSATVRCGKSRFTLSIRSDQADYPKPEEAEDEAIVVTTDGAAFRDAAAKTTYAAATDGSNPTLACVAFSAKDGVLTLEALDGRRVARRRIEADARGASAEALVQARVVNEIQRVVGDGGLTIRFGKERVSFESGDVKVAARVVEGKRVDLDRFFAAEAAREGSSATVNRAEFRDCVDRATLLTREAEAKAISLSIGVDGVRMTMRTDVGEFDETIEAEVEGDEKTMNFNARYLLDLARSADGEEMTISVTDAKSPAVVKDERDEYAYMVLPVVR